MKSLKPSRFEIDDKKETTVPPKDKAETVAEMSPHISLSTGLDMQTQSQTDSEKSK